MKNNKPIITGVVIVLAVVGVLFLLRALFGNKDTEQSPPEEQTPTTVQTGPISGTIQYSGIKPKDGSEGSIYFEYRESGTSEFKRLEGYKFPLLDNAPWSVPNVPVGKLLDARAVIELNNGQKLATSNTITTSAPATEEVFEFNVTLDMIPDYILDKNPVSYGGTVTINGYIPTGSTLSVYTKTLAEADFTEVVRNTPVTGSVTNWQWDNAVAGTLYQVKTEAYQSNGAVFAASYVEEKAAPSTNVNFILTSRATDPTAQTTTTISGNVKVNGEYSDDSEVRIKARVTGTDEYKTVATLSPSNDSKAWSWTEAISGTQYDIKPFLVEEGEDDIVGNKVVTAAPASGINLKIDTQETPDAPEDEPELITCKGLGDNKFNAELKFQNIDGAVKYRLQVGKSEGTADVNDAYVNNSGSNDPTLVSTINGNQDYYARYAYTECSDCSGTDSYSDFSESLEFSCE